MPYAYSIRKSGGFPTASNEWVERRADARGQGRAATIHPIAAAPTRWDRPARGPRPPASRLRPQAGDDQPPWKAKDEAILSTRVRFAKLESEYPGRFRHFCILTNRPLHSESNGQDLCHVLKLIRNAAVEDLPRTIAQWVGRIGAAESLGIPT